MKDPVSFELEGVTYTVERGTHRTQTADGRTIAIGWAETFPEKFVHARIVDEKPTLMDRISAGTLSVQEINSIAHGRRLAAVPENGALSLVAALMNRISADARFTDLEAARYMAALTQIFAEVSEISKRPV